VEVHLAPEGLDKKRLVLRTHRGQSPAGPVYRKPSAPAALTSPAIPRRRGRSRRPMADRSHYLRYSSLHRKACKLTTLRGGGQVSGPFGGKRCSILVLMKSVSTWFVATA
jgi:hypothetical protein